MAAVESAMMPLGTHAPEFTLRNPRTDREESLEELKGEKGTVVMFICNHCPYVKHMQEELVEVAEEYQPKGVAFIAIQSNDADRYPADSPEKMAEVAEKFGYPFPYLYDESQEVARAYDAQCTPDIFLFDENLDLVYRGQFDDSSPGNDIDVSGDDLKAAMNALLAGKTVPQDQKPSIGCSIKWR